MHEFLISTVAFIVLIGVMVVVHEFGHFIVAKLCGVRVEAFSFGFGPRLFGIKYGETDYKVCLLPLGGFVKMTGENPGEEENLAEDPAAFTSHPRWQRMLIGVAGPGFNFILAFVLMVVYFGAINEVPAYEVSTTTVEWVVPGSAAAQAGIQPGDIIRSFNSVNDPTWEKVYERMALDPNRTAPVTVERGGQTLQLAMRVPKELGNDDLAGLLPQYMPGPIGVQEVQPGTPAEKAGLHAGDSIASVDGHTFHTVGSLLAYMQAGQGKPLSMQVVRKGVTLPMVATPAKLDTGWKLGFAVVPIPFRHAPMSVGKAIDKSAQFCADGSTLIMQMLERIVTRRISAKQLSGPVGIAQMAGQAAEMKGWYSKFYLSAEISLNLGVLNLLPFPILDGGLILFLLIESLIRRDIGVEVKERIYQAAFVLLVAFFAFVIFNDVAKLQLFTHLRF
jgi:regulator of sigma E protease